MKRQKIRKALLFSSFVFFPVTMNFFSPYLPVAGAARGVLAGSMLLFAVLLAAAMVLGRGFCGWVCPVAGLQDVCMDSRTRRIRGTWVNRLKYVLFTPWIALFAWLVLKAGGIGSLQPLFMMETGVSVDSAIGLARYYTVVVPILALAYVFGRRAFCHSLCWIAPFMVAGRWMGKVLRLPALRLTPRTPSCTDCRSCTKACPMSLDVAGMVAKNDMSNSECVLCGRCVDTCPKKVIGFAFGPNPVAQ
jgi:ferredoxin-type protein NapH